MARVVRFLLAVGASVGLVGIACVAVLVFAWGRSSDPDLLDPAFRAPAFALLARADAATAGSYTVAETARPAWRQDGLFSLSRATGLTLTKSTSAQGCHVPKRGWNGARAMDVVATGSADEQRTFYLYLKDHARAHGLRSGATFGKPAPNALGWDPGHLELPGCAR